MLGYQMQAIWYVRFVSTVGFIVLDEFVRSHMKHLGSWVSRVVDFCLLVLVEI
jgi:hypothetical protein